MRTLRPMPDEVSCCGNDCSRCMRTSRSPLPETEKATRSDANGVHQDERVRPVREESDSCSSAAPAPARMLRTFEVAELLALSPATVLDRFERDELPGFRLSRKGGPVRFWEHEIMEWIESRRAA